MRSASLLEVLYLSFLVLVHGFAVERRRLFGIWRLASDALPLMQDSLSQLRRSLPKDMKEDILIKLNSDGSFRQCSDEYREGCWMTGRWEVQQEKFMLAMDRQYFGPTHDTLLEGTIHCDDTSMKVEGQVLTGRFMYPKNHPAFFETPSLVSSNTHGTFTMHQAVATHSIVPQEKEKEPIELKYKASDFYGRNFIMTIEPIQHGPSQDDQPVDIRAMPIQFFHNNTFQAHGMNKILRGRFGISQDDQLWFQVSLFGAGRSTSGSVYSEGVGLSHEDKRSYVGEIAENANRIFVAGTVTFGADLGTDARPEPVGMFLLTETIKETKDEDDVFESVFE